jgi:hypothetical protein
VVHEFVWAGNSIEQECQVGSKISGRKYKNLEGLPIQEKQ